MAKKTIEELVHDLETYKVTFIPNKQAYLDFMFEFNWQLFEQSGEVPVHESTQFIPCVKAFIQEDVNKAKSHYYKTDQLYKLWVPNIKYAAKFAKDYLKGKM